MFPLKITLESFQIFSKIRGDTVFTSQGAPSVSTTLVANFATGDTVFTSQGAPSVSTTHSNPAPEKIEIQIA
jgi:hypothetical protein